MNKPEFYYICYSGLDRSNQDFYGNAALSEHPIQMQTRTLETNKDVCRLIILQWAEIPLRLYEISRMYNPSSKDSPLRMKDLDYCDTGAGDGDVTVVALGEDGKSLDKAFDGKMKE